MKHSPKIILILLGMFLLAQLIGLAVINAYSPKQVSMLDSEGNPIQITSYNLPYNLDPPQDLNPQTSLISIVIAVIIGVSLILLLMKFKAEYFLRIWFFFVITLALGITINSVLIGVSYSSFIAFLIALPLSIVKVFKRNILVHNITEVLIYPGIAAIFVPLLNIVTVILLLILISFYDIYAVWHAGFMQKMAKYQIEKVRVFSGFFVPYRAPSKDVKSSPIKSKSGKISVPVAILGGGDVVFPIILAGVVMRQFGLLNALLVPIGAVLALGLLFLFSKKGMFYPAMPFITTGCFISLIAIYFINLF